MEPTTAPQQPPVVPQPQANSKKIIIVLCILLFILYTMGIVLAMLYIKKSQPAPKETAKVQPLVAPQIALSGVIDLNGTPPDNASISISVKQSNKKDFQLALTTIPAVDGTAWEWPGAKNDVEYTLIATLVDANGNQIAQSPQLTITAPAENEILHININQPEAQPKIASISGTFDLNGYIPHKTTISLLARKTGTTQFNTLVSGLAAIDNNTWSIPNIEENQEYDIQAVLAGTTIQSNTITTAAPATGEVLVINSSLTPPIPEQTVVSGTINFNGIAPTNSYVTIGVRNTGTTSFTQIGGQIGASDGSTWSWNGAKTGSSYDLQAYLWTNGTPANQSNILTVDAPATGEVLTINAAQSSGNAPSQSSLSVNCQGVNTATGLWQANISYNNNNAIANAQSFLLTVNSAGNNSQYVNATIAPQNPNQSQSYTTGYVFSPGVLYNAQYAYATCSNCGSFSSFSPSVQFSCSSPAPTNTPSPTPGS